MSKVFCDIFSSRVTIKCVDITGKTKKNKTNRASREIANSKQPIIYIGKKKGANFYVAVKVVAAGRQKQKVHEYVHLEKCAVLLSGKVYSHTVDALHRSSSQLEHRRLMSSGSSSISLTQRGSTGQITKFYQHEEELISIQASSISRLYS